MSDTKELTISNELYKKYKYMQEESNAKAIILSDDYNKKVELKYYEGFKDNKELTASITKMKQQINYNVAVSGILRKFLHEIDLENAEDKTNVK